MRRVIPLNSLDRTVVRFYRDSPRNVSIVPADSSDSGALSWLLAPNAASQDRIIPGPQEVVAEGCDHAEQPSSPQPVYRLSWARLLARVFRVDVPECPACGGKMKIIAALTEPVAIRTYLDGVGLASRPPN